LNENVVKFTKGSLDARKIIGEKFKIIRDKIKDGKLLLGTTRSNSDSSFFIVVDIAHKKTENVFRDPFNLYYATDFDINGPKAVFSSALDSNIFLEDVNNQNKRFDVIKTRLHMTRGGYLVLNKDQLYLLHNVYGVSMVNIQNKKQLYFKDTININSPSACVVSYPLNDNLNVLSGQNASNNKTKLYAIDSKGMIKWSYLTEEFKQGLSTNDVNIIGFEDYFIIAQNSKLTALGKNLGHLVWAMDFHENITGAYKIADNLLVSSADFGHIYPGDSTRFKIRFKLLDSKNGAVIWDKTLNGVGDDPCIGICNGNLLFSDSRKFAVYDLYSGKVKFNIAFSRSERNNYAFTSIADLVTGTYYLKSYDDVYYW
jgi:hypothetical protein